MLYNNQTQKHKSKTPDRVIRWLIFIALSRICQVRGLGWLWKSCWRIAARWEPAPSGLWLPSVLPRSSSESGTTVGWTRITGEIGGLSSGSASGSRKTIAAISAFSVSCFGSGGPKNGRQPITGVWSCSFSRVRRIGFWFWCPLRWLFSCRLSIGHPACALPNIRQWLYWLPWDARIRCARWAYSLCSGICDLQPLPSDRYGLSIITSTSSFDASATLLPPPQLSS